MKLGYSKFLITLLCVDDDDGWDGKHNEYKITKIIHSAWSMNFITFISFLDNGVGKQRWEKLVKQQMAELLGSV